MSLQIPLHYSKPRFRRRFDAVLLNPQPLPPGPPERFAKVGIIVVGG